MVKSQPILRYILRGIPAIAVAVLLSACSANNTAKNMHPETRAVGSETSSLQASQDEFENLVRNVDVKSRIMDQYADWKGVRYRLGGSTKKGIDCSGFVQRTFREQFGLELPRSTYEQQEMGKAKGIVMDGRDIGTVVFPEAELKVFVTASPEVRARRRLEELQAKGEQTTYEEVLANVKKRDYIDSTREESPLRQAPDALVLDNSEMTIPEQKKWLRDQFEAAVCSSK